MAFKQTIMLQPKKLNSINSLNNCLNAGGSPLGCNRQSPSYSQTRGVLAENAETLIFYEDSKLSDYPKLTKLDKLADRIEQCPSGAWLHIYCNSCGEQLTKKPFKSCCLSNFCQEKECLKTRIRIRRMKLQDYYITSKNLFNFVIGFKAVEKITNEFRINCHKTFMKIMKKLEKIYGKVYWLSVRDLNKTKEGKIRLHYHIATLPLKDFRKLTSTLSLICNKIEGVAPSFSGYKKKSSVISYFAKRASGNFGHNRKGEKKFGFSDFMRLEEYYNVFYGTKTFNSNLSYRTRKGSELILMLNNVPKKCPFCHTFTKNNTHPEPVIEKPPDPPPEAPKIAIEYIKIHTENPLNP